MTTPTIGVVPAELRARRQWVLWRVERRDGKPTKVPYRPGSPHRRASATDSESWGTLAEAVAAQQASGAAGVGFVFSAADPYVGLDFDACIDASGEIHPEAAAIVKRLGSYVERSPSGRGLHQIVRGELPGVRHRTNKTPWGGIFEVYDQARFFTMTGRGKGEIAERQEELQQLVGRMLPPAPPAHAPRPNGHAPLDDRELLDRAFAARNGAKVEALYRGDTSSHGGDHSAADLALCGALAFWTGGDPDRLDRLFRASGLMRAKWDAPRGASTYGARTIETALGQRTRTAA
jgi:putative DNA primase/helicase